MNSFPVFQGYDTQKAIFSRLNLLPKTVTAVTLAFKKIWILDGLFNPG